MKRVFVLLFSFIFLVLVLPVQANNIEYVDVCVEFELSVENEGITNTGNDVTVLNKVVIKAQRLTDFNVVIPESNLLCIALSSQEVGFIDTGYLVGYMDSSPSANFSNDFSGVNFKGYMFGDINELHKKFMSAHTKR